jgi:hypothetical protein
MPPNSGNRLLVFGCGCIVSDTHRNSAAEGGQLPGLPEERMPAGLVLIHGRAHGARIAAQPAEAVGARCKPPGQIPGLAAANAAAVDTMNALAANDVEAADLLALARLDDGAPGRCGPPWSQPGRPAPDMKARRKPRCHAAPAIRTHGQRTAEGNVGSLASLLAVAMSSMPPPSTPSTGSALFDRAAGGLHTRDADVLEESDAERRCRPGRGIRLHADQ